MRADLVALGVRLNWVAPDEKKEPALKTVMERLVHEGEGTLLIYDSAASTTQSGSSAKSLPGSDSETQPAPASNGCSQPRRHGPKWAALTQ
jgi:hypothetical protein